MSAGAPPVDGLTPAQRFFLANATLWRVNTSDEMRRTLAQVDPHSPRHLRVRGPVLEPRRLPGGVRASPTTRR